MEKNWYGFNHKAVNKRFEGGLTYINDFCVNDEYRPVAVYKVDNPNREKGHKDYILLQTDDQTLLIRGMDKEEIEKYRYQKAIKCTNCNDVIYSVMRHDYRSCECGAVTIDGGRDYVKIGFDEIPFLTGKIDLLTNEFQEDVCV